MRAKIMRCPKCNRVMTFLPTTAVCLNKNCEQAGVLVARNIKPQIIQANTPGADVAGVKGAQG